MFNNCAFLHKHATCAHLYDEAKKAAAAAAEGEGADVEMAA